MAICDSAGARPPCSHPWLAEALFALDAWLLRRHKVLEYSTHPSCIFRLDIARSGCACVLPDGTRLRAGQRIARLHFWNEHVPPVPPNGPTLAWACEMRQRIALSLCELVRYLSSQSDLGDISMISGEVPCGTRTQCAQLARIMGYFGFAAIAEPDDLSIARQIHRFAENILISLIVFVQNANALRSDSLSRVRVPIYISRRALRDRFAHEAAPSVGGGKQS